VSQGVAEGLAAYAHMIELFARSSQTGLDVSETFAIGELSKGHRQKLFQHEKLFTL
jgi:hypothetical protein